ncbi:hypothetical protein [Streptomyces platensis]
MRPDGVWQGPEVEVPVLVVKVDRSTMASARVAAKFTVYGELFRVKVPDNAPGRSDEEPAGRTVHWWCRAYPGHTRAGYPPVALVATGAGPGSNGPSDLTPPAGATLDLRIGGRPHGRHRARLPPMIRERAVPTNFLTEDQRRRYVN